VGLSPAEPGVSVSLEATLRDRLGRLIGEPLRACEGAIARELASTSVPLIRDLGEYVALAGGKRLRPILLLLCSRLGDGPSGGAAVAAGRAVRLGSVVELLHTATLIHDDVVDRAPLRRGRPSANARWGDDASVLVGDHLYSRCMALLVADGDLTVMDALAAAMVSMTEAEVFQLEKKRDGQLTEADYLRIIRQKTATFMSACCRIGGLVAGLPPAAVEALARYGEHLGIAFQIIDDSLDFDADEARLGKAIGADLREGKRTLPLIATLERATASERARILDVMRRPTRGSGDPAPERDVAEIHQLVKVYDGVGYAVARATAYATLATSELGRFPFSEERDVLGLIADYVIRRDR
jgi:octaprenyl-diphosphate synthase